MVGGRKMLSLLLLAGGSIAAPSFSGTLDSLSLLPLKGEVSSRSLSGLETASFEIRGVVGGRKKRFVVVRADDDNACCGQNKCKTGNQYLNTKTCKCEDCPKDQKPNASRDRCVMECPKGQRPDGLTGKCEKNCPLGKVPSADGKTCVDRKDQCGKGKKRAVDGTCELPCKAGEKKGPDGKCVKDEGDSDPKKKGKCPAGKILDPAEGGQDENTANPKCMIEDKCPAGQVAKTRWPSDKNDASVQKKCMKAPDEKNKRNCNTKTSYKLISAWSEVINGQIVDFAKEECAPTEKYKRNKAKKINEIKPKKQKKWDDEKPARDKKKEEERKKQEEEDKKKKENEKKWKEDAERRDANDKKKTRMGRCMPLTALMEAASMYATSMAKRGLETEAETVKRAESMSYFLDMTTEYFDEDFVLKDDNLEQWPNDLKYNDVDINNDNFIKAYSEWIQHIELKNAPKPCGGLKRCPPRRRELANGTVIYEEVQDNQIMDPFALTPEEEAEIYKRVAADIEERYGDMIKRGVDEHGRPIEKRFIQVLFAIGVFLSRMAQLLTRVISTIARASPRLAGIAKDTARLFRIAPKGTSSATAQQMRTGFQAVARSKFWRKCLEAGKP